MQLKRRSWIKKTRATFSLKKVSGHQGSAHLSLFCFAFIYNTTNCINSSDVLIEGRASCTSNWMRSKWGKKTVNQYFQPQKSPREIKLSSIRRRESLEICPAYQKEFTTQPSRCPVTVFSIRDAIIGLNYWHDNGKIYNIGYRPNMKLKPINQADKVKLLSLT